MKKLPNVWKWIKNEKRILWFEYGILSLAIMLPLLWPGYVLTLDLVFTPHFSLPADITNTYPLQVTLWLLHFILPGDIIEKLVLFAILLLSGVGMHRLVRSIDMKDKIPADVWRAALYFGGMFYMINPFTYARFMAGQWMFLLGYAMVPFFVQALLKFLMQPGRKALIPLLIWAFAAISVSIHHIGIMAIIGILIPLLAWAFGYWRNTQHVKKYLAWSGIGLIALLALTSFWLIPSLLGNGTIGSAVAQMNDAHFEAFATSGNGALGAVGEVIRLQGFWAEDRQLFTLPQSLMPAWGVIFLILWVFVGVGTVKAWKSHRLLAAVGLGSILIGTLLAASPLVSWLSHFTPFVSGYREPHKFASLIVFGYCLLGTFGIAHATTWAVKKYDVLGGQVIILTGLALPLAITPTMLWGFAGQLSPVHYPAGWYDMDKTLSSTAGTQRTLFLPWHQYMEFSFTGRIIANPAEKFFRSPVVVSDDPEYRGAPPTVPNSEKRAIADALEHPDKLKAVLTSHDIHYILFAKEATNTSYAYLDTTTSFQKIAENDTLKLYRVSP